MMPLVDSLRFLQRSALLTTHHCSLISGDNQFAIASPRCQQNKNKCAHRTAVDLQTFLPCFPRIPKLPSDLKLVHWGPSYDFFQHNFFQALIFMSNRCCTSTYYKISINDFFPRIPKLPSDLKLVHWGPSYGSSSTIFFKRSFLCQIATIRVRIIKYQSKIFSQGFQNCPRI